MSATVLAILLVGSLAAGWVDAVVGGGGLILIPLVMILNPGFTSAQALGANKVAAIFGTVTSAFTLARRVPSITTALRFAPLAIAGSAAGALVASSVNKQIMRPIIIALLIGVGVFVAVRPQFGRSDGTFGPGTGLFLIMGFTTLLGGDFIANAAWAKVINVCTNLGALATFAVQGDVPWLLGLALAVTNVVGARIGARMVLGRGAGFVRAVIFVVVVAMAAKLAFDQFAGPIG